MYFRVIIYFKPVDKVNVLSIKKHMPKYQHTYTTLKVWFYTDVNYFVTSFFINMNVILYLCLFAVCIQKSNRIMLYSRVFTLTI